MFLKKNYSNLKFFFVSFLLSLPFWWGINVFQKNLEDFFFWQEVGKDPQIFLAQMVPEKIILPKPKRNWQIEDLKIEAKSAISVLINSQGNQNILFEKNVDEKLPIASLTKLMTAYVVWKNYDLNQIVEISRDAVAKEGDLGNLKIGEIFKAEDLLYPMLIESSNDAVAALSKVIGEENLVDLMNLEVENLGMENTHFFNSTGLDPDNPNDPTNYSTARDLVKFISFLLKNSSKILEISALPEYDLYSADGVFHHRLKNTNQLITEFSGVIASKTGWTPEAQGCLLFVIKAPKNRGVIINVILGSQDRFAEMKKIINWLESAYKW